MKCPMWLVKRCSSQPNFCSGFGIAMTPALPMIASSGAAPDFTAATQARTDAGSESSQASGRKSPLSPAQASRAFSTVRAVASTRAPRSASARIVSRPSPELQPVTSTVLPPRSHPAVASSAVVPYPSPFGPLPFSAPTIDMRRQISHQKKVRRPKDRWAVSGRRGGGALGTRFPSTQQWPGISEQRQAARVVPPVPSTTTPN